MSESVNQIQIKPLSINKAWQGRRFKTPEYKQWREQVNWLLKPYDVPDGDLCLFLEFGVSNMGSDTDNMIKPFQDALQEKYGFNDSRIVSLQAKKTKVAKGSEYIKWSLLSTDEVIENFNNQMKQAIQNMGQE